MTFAVTVWNSSSAGAATQTVATSLQEHDVAIAFVINDNQSIDFITWPSGFVEIQNVIFSPFVDGSRLAWAIKADCTGSEGTINTMNTAAGGHTTQIIGIRGADNNQPLDVVPPSFVNANSAAASPWTRTASITPVTNGCLLLALMDSDVTASAAGTVVHTFSDTGGLSWSKADHGNANFQKMGVGYAVQTTAAATTVTGTGTLATFSADRALALLAIRPYRGRRTPFRNMFWPRRTRYAL